MSKDDLKNLSPFPEEYYLGIPNYDLGTYAFEVIESVGERLTIENICVALFKLFPLKFSMLDYSDYPDGMRVNRTLMQMQPKYQNYATGSANKGYSLTPKGRGIAKSLKEYFDERKKGNSNLINYDKKKESISQRRTLSDDKLIAGIKNSDLYKLYVEEKFDKARGLEFLTMLEAFAHTPPKEIRKRFNELKTAASNTGDVKAIEFLKKCKNKFSSLL